MRYFILIFLFFNFSCSHLKDTVVCDTPIGSVTLDLEPFEVVATNVPGCYQKIIFPFGNSECISEKSFEKIMENAFVLPSESWQQIIQFILKTCKTAKGIKGYECAKILKDLL